MLDQQVFQTNFSTLDWIIVIAYLAVTVGLGVWVNRFVGSLADFLVAGRGLRLYLAIATMTGTEIGLVTIMYNAQEGFVRGLSAYTIGICWGIGLLIVGMTGFIIYRLRELEIMTIPEFYEIRFGRTARVIGGAILALAGILNMGLFLQAGARFVTSVLGIGTGLGLKILMTVMLLLVLLYTSLGGMVSVVITDYLQFVVLGSGMVIATVWAVSHLGWDTIVDAVVQYRGAAGLNPLAEGGYGPFYILWMIYMGVAAGSLWFTATQRALSARSPQVAKQLYAWSSITFFARVVLPVTWGAAALAFISQVPELREVFLPASGEPKLSTQYAMPVFFARFFPSGFLGIITAGMLAAFMSTHDSYLLAWASVITQDVVAPLKGQMTERQRVALTRVLIVLIGLFLLFWGLWYEAPSTLWTYMAITGTIYLAGAFVCIAFGLYWPKATERGAIAALLLGLIALLGILPWKKWGIEWMSETNIAIVTIVLSALGMIVGSLTGRPKLPEAAQGKQAGEG